MSNRLSARRYVETRVNASLDKRLDFIFDRFENVVVSVSGGKDSTVMFHAARAKAESLGRTIHAFFLDQEAEYASTVDIIRHQMSLPAVKPWWFQVPVRMTNATSSDVDMLHAWEPGAEWMRPKEPNSIHENTLGSDRFYRLISAFEKSWNLNSTGFLVGLRAEESLNRYRAVTKNPGLDGINWSSRSNGIVKFYPMYDFTYEDVWIWIARHGVPYNRIYDWLYTKGTPIPNMRVSNLIHEKSFRCLTTLQEFEPDTYEALIRRLPGIRTASLYGKEQTIYNARSRPKAFKTWREYRDFLLETMPDQKARETLLARFSRHEDDEWVHRQQCRQILLKDWENNIPVVNKRKDDSARNKWMDIL